MFYATAHISQQKKAKSAQGFQPEDALAFRPWPASYQHGGLVAFPKTWQVEVGGDVATPQTLTLETLATFPLSNQYRRIISIEGWSYRSRWEGIQLRHLVNHVRPAPGAQFIKQTNASGHVECLPLAVALSGEAILCTREAEKPLTALHGGPLRLLVFDRYCHKGLGQLTKLEFVSAECAGFGETLGYPADGKIKPGRFYAFDLKTFRPVDQPGEVTGY